MTTTDATTSATQTLTILKFLLRDRDYGFIAAATHTTAEHVKSVAEANGWPDKQKVRRALDSIERGTNPRDRIPAAQHTTTPAKPTPRSLPGPRPAPAQPPAPSEGPRRSAPPAPAAPPAGDDLAGLIARGKKSDSKRVQQAAARVEQARDRLVAALEEDETKRREKAKAAAERAAAKQRIAQLEAELAEARRAAGGRAHVRPSRPQREVRAWAKENGYEVADRGFLPEHVVRAYDEAHQ